MYNAMLKLDLWIVFHYKNPDVLDETTIKIDTILPSYTDCVNWIRNVYSEWYTKEAITVKSAYRVTISEQALIESEKPYFFMDYAFNKQGKNKYFYIRHMTEMVDTAKLAANAKPCKECIGK